jgi:hypothetical protein
MRDRLLGANEIPPQLDDQSEKNPFYKKTDTDNSSN